MVIITKYRLEYNPQNDTYTVWADEENVCPICGSEDMRLKGRRKRQVIVRDQETQVLRIQRLKCGGCNKIHHELPDLIVPYKRHCIQTIELIVNGDEEDTDCEESTINRIKAWWKSIRLYVEGVTASLIVKHGITFSENRKFAQIVRALANSHLWPGTRSVWESYGK